MKWDSINKCNINRRGRMGTRWNRRMRSQSLVSGPVARRPMASHLHCTEPCSTEKLEFFVVLGWTAYSQSKSNSIHILLSPTFKTKWFYPNLLFLGSSITLLKLLAVVRPTWPSLRRFMDILARRLAGVDILDWHGNKGRVTSSKKSSILRI